MTMQQENKDVVRQAFDTLFNRRDYEAAERFWSPDYIQHSAHIPPGRQGLFDLIRQMPDSFRHEAHLILGEGDKVMVWGRFSGMGLPAAWVVVDTVRMQSGLLAEHWDVVEDEVSREASASGLPMLGDSFPEDR